MTVFDPKDEAPKLLRRVVVLAQRRYDKRPRPAIRSWRELASLMEPGANLDREAFWVLPMDASNRLIGLYVANIGTATSAVVDIPAVLRVLLATQAASVTFVHNHPSGHSAPSPEDSGLLRRLKSALDLFEIDLFDNVIVGQNGAFSYAEARML